MIFILVRWVFFFLQVVLVVLNCCRKIKVWLYPSYVQMSF